MRKFVLLIMAVLSVSAWALAQNRQISGTVTNADGKPIAGATVLVEGTSTGTTTNTDGKFSVSAPANGTLAVSFIGYETVKVAIAGKTQVNVSLREDTHAIDDVIVVAYGTAKKESFTGSVAVVKSEELEHRKVSNVTKALDGIKQILNPAESSWPTETGWRLMFVSEAFPGGLFTLLVLFVPETPRYLAMSGNDDKALAVLSRINGITQARAILAEIKATAHEKTEKLFTYGWLVIFIGIMLSVFQQAVGINAVLYFAPRIFESMGMGNPMIQTVIMGIVNITFTLVAVFTVEKLGRKPLLITGSIGMAIGALMVALCNLVTLPPIVSVVSIMIYSASFMFSWGPICWVLIAEIFPNTIRGAAVAIAVAFQWIFNFIVSSTFVPMYNMTAGDMGEKFGHMFAYALYGIICVIAAIFVWKLVPETKGKTLEDMNKLWKKNK